METRWLAFIGGVGMPELLVVLVILLLIFGGSRIPGIARSLGKSLGEFKKGRQEGASPQDPTPPEDKPADKHD